MDRKQQQLDAIRRNAAIRAAYSFELFVTGKDTPIKRRRWRVWRALVAMF